MAIAAQADSDEVELAVKRLRSELGDPEVVLLGVDRLDYTKGIDLRLKAVRELLIEHRLDPRKTAVIQVAVPAGRQYSATTACETGSSSSWA